MCEEVRLVGDQSQTCEQSFERCAVFQRNHAIAVRNKHKAKFARKPVMAPRQFTANVNPGADTVADKDQDKGVQPHRNPCDPFCYGSSAGIVVQTDGEAGFAFQYLDNGMRLGQANNPRIAKRRMHTRRRWHGNPDAQNLG